MPLPGVGVFGGGGHKPLLEILPDSTFVVFYGAPSESQVAELTGKLVLTNYEAMNVRSIKLGLLGMRRTSWSTTNTITPQPILTKVGFHRDDKNLFPADGSKNKPHKINPGVHEWNFSFKMPSYLDESVEGIDTNWIVYNLNATVDRGYLTKQLTATKHIRVVRTLGRDMLETQPMEQINEDIWASKLAYKITVPQKNYIVGTSITADFVLIPLRKGVEISTIRMDLIESRMLYSEYAGRRISHSDDRIIVQKEGPLPQNSIQELPEDDENADHLFDEAHRFQMTLDLPKSLRKCRQSVDTEYLRITHKLRIYVNLHNPEGHTSQLLVKNHIHLFISPNLPPNEDQSVSVDEGILTSQQMREEALQNAPPTYGQHQLDELYNDIDPSGFMTPGGRGTSGANTPFYGHSRQGSIEDLAALGNIVHQTDGGASITALHSRLNNLNISDNRSPWQNSSGGSTPSGYFAGVEPYDMEALVRTPSYNTAVRTPARTPIGDLPTYEVATSRPSSPSHTPRSGHTSPSPTRSLDTLAEETERNTELNSRRTSPSRSSRRSDEQSLRSASTSTTASTASTSSTHSRPSSSGILGRKILFSSKPIMHPRTRSAPSPSTSTSTLPKPVVLLPTPTLTITPPPSPPESESDTITHTHTHTFDIVSDPDHYDYPPHHPSATSSMSKRDTLSSISILRSALRGSRRDSG